MLLTYPALFYNELDGGYFIYFPDLPEYSGTQGEDINDAFNMASEYLGIVLADDLENGRELSKPSNINDLSLEGDNPFKDDEDFIYEYNSSESFVSYVRVNVTDFINMDDPIKKTLSIPKWADKIGKELHINFSQTLTEAIVAKKMSS